MNIIASLSKIRFKFSDLYGEDVIALTKSQVDRLVKAYEEKRGMTIRNVKNAISPQHENRRWIFTGVSWIDSIPNWNCLASFSGFIGTGEHGSTKTNWKWVVSKEGKWCVCRTETDGRGLYLGPASGRGFETVGNGLYLMKQGGLHDGRGLISGSNSPFKNIPILVMIL